MKSRFLIVLAFLALSPFFAKAQTNQNFNKTYQTTPRDFETENAHIHVREDGEVIASFKNKEQEKEFYEKMEKAFPNNSKDLPEDPQDPMYGLNEYVPAYDTLYQTRTDWYGSGDVNNDGVINWDDYNLTITGNDPFNDGTYRGDTDLDGVSGTASDKQIIYEYLTGERNHINKWEFETVDEKINHLEKALAIDPTDLIDPFIAGWLCAQYSSQLFVNFRGVYDIENSVFAQNNGTNLQYDISHNGIFRTDLQKVSVITTSGVPHAINNAYLGAPNNQNTLEFNYKIYIEPQSDEFVEPGDFSFNPNEYAKEKWYGYYYNNPQQQWKYGSRRLVEYDLNQGNPTLTYYHGGLVLPWTPLDKVVYPDDQEHEYFVGINSTLEPGYPDSLYVGTQVNVLMDSTQTNNQTCSDVTFNQEYNWDLVAGAYNSSNTPQASHVQNIFVHDWTGPEFSSFPSDTLITKDDSMSPEFLGYPEFSDNSGLAVDSSYYDELLSGDDPFEYWARHWTGIDVCENQSIDSIQYITVDLLEGINNKKSLESVLGNPFPNPTKGKFTIPYFSTSTKNIYFKFYNSQGQELENIAIKPEQIGKNKLNLDLSKYASGLYFLNVNNGESVETKKIFVK